MLQIRQSDDKTFYNLLEIDKDGGEKIIATDTDLKALKNHDKAKGQKLDVVAEADTRGTIEQPEE